MAARYLPTELSDNSGNIVYPHSEADIIWMQDGRDVEEVLKRLDELLNGITGISSVRNLDDATKLATAKAVNSLSALIDALNNNLGGYSFGTTAEGQPGYRKPGADTVTPFRQFPSFLSKHIDHNRYTKYTNSASKDQLLIGVATYYYFDGNQNISYKTQGTVNVIHSLKSESYNFTMFCILAVLSSKSSIEIYTHDTTGNQGDSHSKVGYMVFDF